MRSTVFFVLLFSFYGVFDWHRGKYRWVLRSCQELFGVEVVYFVLNLYTISLFVWNFLNFITSYGVCMEFMLGGRSSNF